MLSSSLRMELKTVRGNSNRIYFVLKPWHPIAQIHSKWSLKFQKKVTMKKTQNSGLQNFIADNFDAVGSHIHRYTSFNPLHGFLSTQQETIYMSVCLTVLPGLCKMFINEGKRNFLRHLLFSLLLFSRLLLSIIVCSMCWDGWGID